jgi:hypothetical protein
MSWWQLLAIEKEMRENALYWKTAPPQACPQDGQPLEYHPGKGVLHCKFCGFTTVGRPDQGG